MSTKSLALVAGFDAPCDAAGLDGAAVCGCEYAMPTLKIKIRAAKIILLNCLFISLSPFVFAQNRSAVLSRFSIALLSLRGFVSRLNGIRLQHVFAMLRLSVPARSPLVVHASIGIDPHQTRGARRKCMRLC